MSDLTAKQKRFVEEYVIDFNGKQAAIRAGYSKKTAEVQGSKLLSNPKLATALRKAQAKLAQRAEITADRIIKELATIAFSDIGEAFDDEGCLITPKEMPESIRRALAGVDVVTFAPKDAPVEYTHKLKIADKQRALELLGKHLGLFADRVQHEGAVTFEIVTGIEEPVHGNSNRS